MGRKIGTCKYFNYKTVEQLAGFIDASDKKSSYLKLNCWMKIQKDKTQNYNSSDDFVYSYDHSRFIRKLVHGIERYARDTCKAFVPGWDSRFFICVTEVPDSLVNNGKAFITIDIQLFSSKDINLSDLQVVGGLILDWISCYDSITLHENSKMLHD